MTEADAKTKWCPFARTLDYASDVARAGDEPQLVSASVNREVGEYDRQGNETVVVQGRRRCISSECMAWRWVENAEFRSRADRAYARDGTHLKPERGYCGLAGAPQP